MNNTPIFSMGLSTYKVPFSLHEINRSNLIKKLLCQNSRVSNLDMVVLKGGVDQSRNDTDHEPIFRQESYFHYLFGVKEPNFYGLIDLTTKQTILFCPRYPREYATFMGRLAPPEEMCSHYGVNDVKYMDELESYLEGLLVERCNGAENDGSKDHHGKLLLLKGLNSDSGNWYQPPVFKSQLLNDKGNVDILFPILADARVMKSEEELKLLRHVTKVTSQAHTYVMRNITPSNSEFQLESLFRHYCYYNYGHRHTGYTPICACGPNSAILHYGHAGAPNDVPLGPDKMCLLDMGSEYHCYGSDVTCSYPARGVFQNREKIIYNAVLQAQITVMGMLKPGVSYLDCHKAAETTILKALLDFGILLNPMKEDISVLVDKRLGGVFMPHGLGHFIGIDTHDVGGYLDGHPKRPSGLGLKSLRTARIMQPNMVLTVEPGCYFIDHLLNEALDPDSELQLSQYFDEDKIEEYRGFGGVRLEDVVMITEDGCVNLTCCARTVEEVERVMGGGKWPPIVDEAPELKRKYLTDPN